MFFMKIVFLVGCFGNLEFHRLIMDKIETMAFNAKLLQIFGRIFYRNVSYVVFYQPYIFWPISGSHDPDGRHAHIW